MADYIITGSTTTNLGPPYMKNDVSLPTTGGPTFSLSWTINVTKKKVTMVLKKTNDKPVTTAWKGGSRFNALILNASGFDTSKGFLFNITGNPAKGKTWTQPYSYTGNLPEIKISSQYWIEGNGYKNGKLDTIPGKDPNVWHNIVNIRLTQPLKTSVKCNGVSYNAATFTITATSGGSKLTDIKYSRSTSTPGTPSTSISGVSGTLKMFTISGLTQNTTYNFAFKSWDDAAFCENYISITTQAKPATPGEIIGTLPPIAGTAALTIPEYFQYGVHAQFDFNDNLSFVKKYNRSVHFWIERNTSVSKEDWRYIGDMPVKVIPINNTATNNTHDVQTGTDFRYNSSDEYMIGPGSVNYLRYATQYRIKAAKRWSTTIGPNSQLNGEILPATVVDLVKTFTTGDIAPKFDISVNSHLDWLEFTIKLKDLSNDFTVAEPLKDDKGCIFSGNDNTSTSPTIVVETVLVDEDTNRLIKIPYTDPDGHKRIDIYEDHLDDLHTTTVTVSRLDPGTAYTLRVEVKPERALNADTISSDCLTVTTLPIPSLLKASKGFGSYINPEPTVGQDISYEIENYPYDWSADRVWKKVPFEYTIGSAVDTYDILSNTTTQHEANLNKLVFRKVDGDGGRNGLYVGIFTAVDTKTEWCRCDRREIKGELEYCILTPYEIYMTIERELIDLADDDDIDEEFEEVVQQLPDPEYTDPVIPEWHTPVPETNSNFDIEDEMMISRWSFGTGFISDSTVFGKITNGTYGPTYTETYSSVDILDIDAKLGIIGAVPTQSTSAASPDPNSYNLAIIGWNVGTGDKYMKFEFNTIGSTGFSFNAKLYVNYLGPRYFAIEYSVDNGNTWVMINKQQWTHRVSGQDIVVEYSVDLITAAQNYPRWLYGSPTDIINSYPISVSNSDVADKEKVIVRFRLASDFSVNVSTDGNYNSKVTDQSKLIVTKIRIGQSLDKIKVADGNSGIDDEIIFDDIDYQYPKYDDNWINDPTLQPSDIGVTEIFTFRPRHDSNTGWLSLNEDEWDLMYSLFTNYGDTSEFIITIHTKNLSGMYPDRDYVEAESLRKHGYMFPQRVKIRVDGQIRTAWSKPEEDIYDSEGNLISAIIFRDQVYYKTNDGMIHKAILWIRRKNDKNEVVTLRCRMPYDTVKKTIKESQSNGTYKNNPPPTIPPTTIPDYLE